MLLAGVHREAPKSRDGEADVRARDAREVEELADARAIERLPSSEYSVDLPGLGAGRRVDIFGSAARRVNRIHVVTSHIAKERVRAQNLLGEGGLGERGAASGDVLVYRHT